MPIQSSRRGHALAALLTLASVVQARASVVLFTDRAAWRTGSGGGSGNITDNLDSGAYTSTLITRPSFTISAGGAGLPFFPNGNATMTVDGTGFLRVSTLGSGGVLALTFSSPISSLGFEINPQSSSVGASISYALNGSGAGAYLLPSTDVTEFRGIVSSTPFTTFTLTTAATAYLHGIDNVEAYTAVPEPGWSTAATSLALLVAAPMLVRRCRNVRT